MNISSVNSVTFDGRMKTTRKGNPYKKTNAGKVTGLSTGIGITLIGLAGVKGLGGFKLLQKKLMIAPVSAKSAFYFGAAVITGALIGFGAIIDGFVNHSRRKKANREGDLNAKIDAKVDEKLNEKLEEAFAE